MAAVIAPTSDHSLNADRLKVLRADLAKRLEEAELNKGFSGDGKAKFDELSAEFTRLKTAVLGADALTKAKEQLREFDQCMENPRPTGLSPEQIESDLAIQREDVLANRGSARLRNFRPYGDNREKNRKAALTAGLVMLARATKGTHQEWALSQLAKRGESLAQISPYMGEDGQATGGYLVFPEFEAELINLKEQYGTLERDAYKIGMKSDTKNIPRRAGGTTVYYPDENQQIPASAMAFDKVMLIAKKYAQLALWSSELDEDSVISFTDLLTSEMAYQFAKAEDFNGAQGDGTSTYAGVVGFLQALVSGKNGVVPTASLVKITAGSGWTSPAAWLAGATTAQILGAWNGLVATLPVYAEGRAKLYCHKTIFWQLIAPVIEAAGGNIAMYLTSGIPLKFLGYDVELMQAMPTYSQVSGTAAANLQLAAVLGDMRSTCFMGTRRGVRVKTSDERFLEFDQLAIQCTQRVAINNVMGDSVAPTAQAGPMVGLQFPAT